MDPRISNFEQFKCNGEEGKSNCEFYRNYSTKKMSVGKLVSFEWNIAKTNNCILLTAIKVNQIVNFTEIILLKKMSAGKLVSFE